MVGALWALWPGSSRREATAALCICLAAGCAIAAALQHESIKSATLNRWFEGFILALVAALVLVLS